MATQLNSNQATSWINWVVDFDRTYGLFQTVRANLTAQQAYMQQRLPQLSNRYWTLQNRANQIAGQLAQLKAQRDNVVMWLATIGRRVDNIRNGTMAWLRNRYGLGAAEYANEFLEELGVAPVVWVGLGLTAAAAAVASAAYWINDTQQLLAVIAEAQRLEQAGMPPADAARTAQNYRDTDNFMPGIDASGIAGVPWLYIAAGALALVALPRILNRGA